MIEIEFSEPHRSVCDCCGGETTALTRFVKKDGNAYAVYYGFFTEGHPERGMTGIVSLGEWGEGTFPSDRAAFGFVMWSEEERYSVRLIDAKDTPWGGAEILGAKLTSVEAKDHPWKDDVYQLSDEIADNDPEVRAFFGQESIH